MLAMGSQTGQADIFNGRDFKVLSHLGKEGVLRPSAGEEKGGLPGKVSLPPSPAMWNLKQHRSEPPFFPQGSPS